MNQNNSEGFKKALEFFKESAKNVPAYKLFLKEHKINPRTTKSYSDFAKVPYISKENYLRKYDFFDLFAKGKISSMVSASSGSSGKPFYWPRGVEQEEVGGRIHQRIFKQSFRIKKNERTLVIICFSMGTWIAGTFTLASIKWIATHGYNVSVITPGIDKEDTIRILSDFAPLFDRVVIAGYPPFVRDVIEESKIRKINIKRLKLNFIFAGENFSEKYRQIIHKRAGITDMFFGSVSIYGTADAGAIGYETPASIFIRKTASINKKFAKEFWIESFMPTILQYDPTHVFFETVSGKIIFTTSSGIPLIRYNIQDTGRLVTHDEMRNILKKYELWTKVKKYGFEKLKMPFLFLGSRTDVATTFYALNIYPENIKIGLENNDLNKLVSGKFIAYNKLFNNGRHQKLFIEVELAREVKPSKHIKIKICSSIFNALMNLNTEYRKLYNSIGKKALPNILPIYFGDLRFAVKKSKIVWSRNETSAIK